MIIMIFVVSLIIMASQCKFGAAWFQMLSRGRVVIARVGETVRLDCDFYTNQFNLFDNPLLWEKTQFTSDAVNINMMGKILEPFASTRRFETKLIQESPRYSIELTINDARSEDNGNYTCVVNGPENTRRGITQHALIVTALIDNISISTVDQSNGTKNNEQEEEEEDDEDDYYHLQSHQRSLTITEGEPRHVRCVAHGGYPPPDVTIKLGNRDVTNYFRLMRTSTLIGVVGLQLKYYVTERVVRSESDFRFGPEDDGRQLRCVATTTDVATNNSVTRIVVHYAPKIQCQSKSLTLNEVNVFLRCEVRARPRPSIKWVIDDDGTTVTEDQERNGCYVIVTEQKRHLLEVQLILRKLTAEKFRDYELIADNSIGTSRHTVSLLRNTAPLSSTRKSIPVVRSSVVAMPHNSRQEKKDRRFTPSLGVAFSRRPIALSLLLSALHVTFELSGIT